MPKYVISSGHGLYVRGASGYLDEVNEARKVVEKVAEFWRASGVGVETYHDDVSRSQSENLNRIVSEHNKRSRDLDVSVHFNAYQTTSKPMGTEVLYVTQSSLASKVSAALASAQSLPNRGGKYRSDLAFLNGTSKPAILIETCFVDSSTDANNYRANFDAACEAIAESISGVQVPGEPPPIEPPVEPPTEPEIPSEDNRVDITGTVSGDVTVTFNGDVVYGGAARCPNMVELTLNKQGDVTVIINGEEFHNNPPPEPPETPAANQTDIITTVFGGDADNEYSAYGPYDSQGRGPYLNDEDNYVSLPWTVPNAGLYADVRVKVTNRANGKSAVGTVADKGPWYFDNPYPELNQRPLAEQQFIAHEPCDHGPNKGVIPNGAGIDISPAMASALGISGKGKVNWEFVEPETA